MTTNDNMELRIREVAQQLFFFLLLSVGCSFFSFRFLLSGLRCRQITAALSSLYERTVRPSRPMIFSCIRSSLADRKYRPARSVSKRM